MKVAALGIPWPEVSGSHAPAAVSQAVLLHLAASMADVLTQQPDIVLLPELCDRPKNFTQQDYLAYIVQRDDTVLQFLKTTAKTHRIFLLYPTVRAAGNGIFFNSVFFIGPQGETIGIYDKNHPCIGEYEDGFQGGTAPLVLDCDLGRLGFVLCFDLNFTGLLEQYRTLKPDLLFFSSAFHGGLLQNWWAYRSGAYFISAAAGLGAAVIAPTGQSLAASTNYYPSAVYTVNLDRAVVHLDYNREKISSAMARYQTAVGVQDPGNLGSVLLTSESDARSIQEILQEFQIEPLDDYLYRCEQMQIKNKQNRG